MGVTNGVHWLDFAILFTLFAVACMIAMNAEDIFQRRQHVPLSEGRNEVTPLFDQEVDE
jgi:hypothetical protein